MADEYTVERPTPSGWRPPLVNPFLGALVALVLGAGVGLLLGITVGAADSGGAASMTVQPLEGADKVFNWLLFSIFTAAGVIACAVTYAGMTIARETRALDK